MNFLNTIISENVINALGWTILHSLWQGAAVALGFALVLFFMRRFSARTRYVMGIMAMVLILAMSVVTFANLYESEVAAAAAAAGGQEEVLTAAVQLEQGFSLTGFFKNYFNRHLPLVVTLWMLGVLVLMLRFAGGFLYNQRIKTHHTRPLAESWQNRLQRFCRQAGISKTVKLVESALIKVPMTIGHIKPVLLLPIGLVTGMPRDQVEALLAHELAHIMRKDYLFNILQNIVDILFFYHPGVRWTSAHVRAERENCCDDIAASLCGGSLNVARALTNIQDYRPGALDPAMAASGGNTGSFSLLTRVKRLLNPPAMGSRLSEGAVGASILVMALFTLVISANAATAMNNGNPMDEMAPAPVTAPAPEPAPAVASDEEDKLKKEKEEQENQQKLREMEIKLAKLRDDAKKKKVLLKEFKKKLAGRDGKLTDEEKRALDKMRAGLKEYEEKIKKIDQILRDQGLNTQLSKAEQKRKQEEFLKKREVLKLTQQKYKQKLKELKAREKELSDDEKKKMTVLMADMKKREQKLRQMEEYIKSREMAASKHEQKEFELARKKLMVENAMAKKKLSELFKKQAELEKQNEKLSEAEMKKLALLKAGLKEREQKMKQMEMVMRSEEKKAEKLRVVFTKELLADKLIDNADHFEVKLRLWAMYVNGKKVPDTVYKKYKKIYEKVSGKPLMKNKSFMLRM